MLPESRCANFASLVWPTFCCFYRWQDEYDPASPKWEKTEEKKEKRREDKEEEFKDTDYIAKVVTADVQVGMMCSPSCFFVSLALHRFA